MSAADTTEPIRLPTRDTAGHKGTFGTLCVIGGCARAETPMIGAPALSARAAFRSSCGLVRLAMPRPVLISGLQLEPSATGIGIEVDELANPFATDALQSRVRESDALVLGPGLGAERTREHHIARFVESCIGLGLPAVVDADGLNALASGGSFSKVDLSRCILTPHPGEYARLAKARGIPADPTSHDERPAAAAALARSLKCVVVLKGAHTVVSDGERHWICNHGHACMATAGTGDVLAGLIGSLIAQLRNSDASLYEIAKLGVQVHALAGERWAQQSGTQAGMLARELADLLPAVLEEMR